MVNIVQKLNNAVHGNVALTAFQTAIRQQVEFKEAVEESKERDRETEAQRQREAEERLSKLAENASYDESATATNDSATSEQGSGQAADGRGGTVDVKV